MKLIPCPFCYYQRTFMMGIVGLMLIGLLTGMNRQVPLSLLALPLAAAGLAMAIFHVNLEATRVLECPAGIMGIGSAPQQSLGAFVLVTLFLLVDACQRSNLLQGGAITIMGSVIVGVALAAGSVVSSPPAVQPTEEYKTPLNICRPPFKG
jgi:disulfide bond formation protein DsbB